MIAPDREERFASYDEVIEVPEQARDALNPSGKKARRRRFAIAAVILAAALGGGRFYFHKIQTERRRRGERQAAAPELDPVAPWPGEFAARLHNAGANRL
jgi:uncharacterized protein HemX